MVGINDIIEKAKAKAHQSSCLRRRYGAVITDNECNIISSGTNHSVVKDHDCASIHKCIRMENNIPHGSNYEYCRSIHAEADAILKLGHDRTSGAYLYLIGYDHEWNQLENPECCIMCKRMIIEAGISLVRSIQSDGSIKDIDPLSWTTIPEL